MQHLLDAQMELSSEVGKITSVSNVYENPPNGFDAEHDFLNICVELTTDFSPEDLLNKIKEIEQRIGRIINKEPGYTSRCIDIDIILYDKLVMQSEELTIPHQHFRKRLFVLKPLSDIALNQIDPETMLLVGQLLKNCSDPSTMLNYSQ